MLQNAELVVALSNLEAFARLTDEGLAQVVDYGEITHFESGAVLMEEGKAAAFFVVVEGRVTLKLRARRGRDVDLPELGVGAVLGEIGLLCNSPTSATVTAVAPTRCFRLDRWSYDQLVEFHPSTGCALTVGIAQALGERIQRMNHRLVLLLERASALDALEQQTAVAESFADALQGTRASGTDESA